MAKAVKQQEGMIRTVVNREDYEDRYATKLVKYIPAEVLAAFIPLVALAAKIEGNGSPWIWATIGMGAIAVVGYFRWQATDGLEGQLRAIHGRGSDDEWPEEKLQDELKKRQPHSYFYFLALVAFAAWALATAAPVRQAAGLQAAEAEYVVAAVTFLLPLADATLLHFWRWRDERHQRSDALLLAISIRKGG
ncbi:MAG TPA: hypothetical protein VF731_00375 [Solirubrobacterales bacterium]